MLKYWSVKLYNANGCWRDGRNVWPPGVLRASTQSDKVFDTLQSSSRSEGLGVIGRAISSVLMRSVNVPGTPAWLIAKEIQYGGFHTDVKRIRVSPHDRRTVEELRCGGMTGGDRMQHHGYARHYAKFLKRYIRRGVGPIIAEIGILRGTGLALWCDLFPNGRIIGLDIDIGHFRANWSQLWAYGAFRSRVPEVHEFDQFLDNTGLLEKLLQGSKIDVCIDDGVHTNEAILTTFRSVRQFLARDFVYFIEDNREVGSLIEREFPRLRVRRFDELTVLQP